MVITVHVKPGSARAGVSRRHDGTLVVRVHARPVDGAANAAVRDALADALGVPRSRVNVLTPRGRTKRVDVPEETAAVLHLLPTE